MNHYAPRQREDNKKWHYTCENDGRIWPVGYCGAYRTCPECNGKLHVDGEPCTRCAKEGIGPTGAVRVPDEERCPGHDTAAEACEHYRQYLLNERTHEVEFGDWTGCQECDAPTKKGYAVGAVETVALCDEHRTPETLAKHVTVGEAWSSY